MADGEFGVGRNRHSWCGVRGHPTLNNLQTQQGGMKPFSGHVTLCLLSAYTRRRHQSRPPREKFLMKIVHLLGVSIHRGKTKRRARSGTALLQAQFTNKKPDGGRDSGGVSAEKVERSTRLSPIDKRLELAPG